MDPMDPMGGGGGMTPEQIRVLMEYSANQDAFDAQDRAIQQQIKMAEALRNRGQSQHTTGAGAMLGGVGDVLNAYTAKRDMNTAHGEDMLLQLRRAAELKKRAAAQNPRPLPGYDAQSNSLMDPSGATYMMPGPIR